MCNDRNTTSSPEIYIPFMRRTLCLFAILLLIPALAFSQSRMHPVMGHPPADPMPDMFMNASPSTVLGTVSAVNGNLISIAKGLIVIDASDAKIVGPFNAAATIASIEPGDLISVNVKNGNVAAGAPVPAALIGIIKIPETELNGQVQAVDTAAKSFTVLGTTIHVTPETRFVSGPFGAPITGIEGIHVGDFVVVTATASNGKLLADTVVAPGLLNVSTKEIHGKVKSIGTDSWIITDNSNKDVTVKVTSQTKILGSPVVGSTVDAFVLIDSSNQYVALTIIDSSNLIPIPPLLTYRGIVKKITPGTWTVRDDATNTDLDFLVWFGTKIDPGIAVGARVIVTARTDDYKNRVAYTITKAP